MLRYLATVVFLLLGAHLRAQDGVLVEGLVVDAQTKAPLYTAHVMLNDSFGTTPDIEGKIKLKVRFGDTLWITHVGYNDQVVIIPKTLKEENYFLRIGMVRSVMELDEVTIYQWPATLADFKNEILALDPPQEDRIHIPGSYYGPRRPVEPGVGSPISFLASKLSRIAKQRREFLKKKRDILEHSAARTRWQADYVKEVTGISDAQELLSFMEYCKFTDQYLGDLNEYDLIVAINHCYEDFKQNQ